MFQILLIVHGVLCLMLIGLVLLQQGKGADAGAIMGGSGDSIFGPGGGGSFASRLTTGIAVGFMVTSILLIKAYGSGAYVKKQAPSPLEGSIMDQTAAPELPPEALPPPADGAAGAAAPVQPAPAAAPAQPAPAAAVQVTPPAAQQAPEKSADKTVPASGEKPAK